MARNLVDLQGPDLVENQQWVHCGEQGCSFLLYHVPAWCYIPPASCSVAMAEPEMTDLQKHLSLLQHLLGPMISACEPGPQAQARQWGKHAQEKASRDLAGFKASSRVEAQQLQSGMLASPRDSELTQPRHWFS